MKFLIILGFVTLTFASKNKTLSARNDIDLIDENEDNSADNLQKRESGYLYSRPRISFPSRIKNRRPARIVRPFMTYGPPKSPIHSPSKNKYQNVNSNRPNPQFQAPDPLRIAEFTKPDPIASQNEEPFKSTSANYLPPKNQKLPTHPATYFQQSQSFQSQKLLQNPGNQFSPPSQISDAAQFLRQNAPAISQLYKTPAINENYEPLPEQNPTISSRSHQLENLPSYASGTLEPYRSLQQIQSLEKDQLIANLRNQLAAQDSQRFVQQGNFLSNLEAQNPGIVGQAVYGPPSPADQQNPGASQGSNSHLQPANSPTSFGIPGAFPFPQFAEGLPVIGGTNFGSGTSLPGFFGSNVPGQIDAPTHFSIPIPSLGNNNKPLTPASSKPSFPSVHPVSGGHQHPVTPVVNPFPQPLPHPLPQPIQPIHPVQPILGVQTVPVSPVILKPVKPVFPVYYPSLPYVIQKPSLTAPPYSVIKSGQIW